MRRKCPREGTRLKFDANPASAALYSPPIPMRGEVGTVVSVPLPGAGRKTCTGGHSQDLVYVNWPSVGTMGVARGDVSKAKGKGPRQLQVNGENDKFQPTGTRVGSWVVRERSTGKVMFETFDEEVVRKLNTKKYEAVPILQYLQELNRGIKGFGESAYRLSVGQRVTTPLGPGSITMVRGIHAGVQLDDGKFAHFTVSNVTPTGERQRFFNGLGDVQYQHSGE